MPLRWVSQVAKAAGSSSTARGNEMADIVATPVLASNASPLPTRPARSPEDSSSDQEGLGRPDPHMRQTLEVVEGKPLPASRRIRDRTEGSCFDAGHEQPGAKSDPRFMTAGAPPCHTQDLKTYAVPPPFPPACAIEATTVMIRRVAIERARPASRSHPRFSQAFFRGSCRPSSVGVHRSAPD